MSRFKILLVAAALACALPAMDGASAATSACGVPFATVSAGDTTIGNDCVRRTWNGDGVSTSSIFDVRTGMILGGDADFALSIAGRRIPSSAMTVRAVTPASTGRVASLTWILDVTPALAVVRRVEVFEGIAGFRASTELHPTGAAVLGGYSLDQVVVGTASTAIQAFRAGGDWREPGWNPSLTLGDGHGGDWRATSAKGPGVANAANGEWISAQVANGARVAIAMERRNYPSSRMAYNGSVARAEVDYSRDVTIAGPFEESVHAEHPADGPGRHRVLGSDPVTLEPVLTFLGTDADDEPWQFHRYLTEHRYADFHKGVIFNTDKVDVNARSTGAKDDADYERFLSLLPAAREMGVDTFVFDDGWMARSGDWCPDSPDCPEPRWDGTPGSKFRPRFPDATFAAVQQALRGDPNDPTDDVALGLWMNPMAFNPSANAFRANPQWSCAPVGTATGAANAADPDGSLATDSNEAGIGLWNPLALGVHPDDMSGPVRMIDYLEGRILRAIQTYGASYFKFDFMVWSDCAGVAPADLYSYHDAFVEMLDRIHQTHPGVVFQIDDTNDYRMFPFETVARGPSWFVNGSPSIAQQLHNVWSLAPEIPSAALGARVYSNGAERALGIDAIMAAALPEHITFSFPIDTDLTASQRARFKRWAEFYRTYAGELTGMTYPLLADPITEGWTALQQWNKDEARGWLLAYRQKAANATQAIALRGLPASGWFKVTAYDPGAGTIGLVQTYSAAELRAGVPVTIPVANGYALLRVQPA